MRVQQSWPLLASHSFTVLSQLALATRCPSGENATPQTASECPVEGAEFLAAAGVPQLHGLVLAGAGHPLPVGRERHAQDPAECPVRVRSSLPLLASHSFTVLSSLALATRCPSGENATPRPRRNAR